jgi:hypothetical protein
MNETNKAESSAQSLRSEALVSPTVAPAQPENSTTNRKVAIAIAIGAIVFLALTILIIALLYSNPTSTAVIRDIFIIALAFTSFFIGIAMLVLVFQLQALIGLLRNEIKPMLTNANQTVNAVRGTAVFVSDNLVKPTIGVASFFAGVRGVKDAVSGRVKRSARRKSRSSSPGSASSKSI